MKGKKTQFVLKQHMYVYIAFCWFIIWICIGSLYINTNKSVYEKWKVQKKNTLSSLQYCMDYQFKNIENIIGDMLTRNNIRSFKLEDQIVEVMELQKELKRINRLNPLVEEVIIYLKDNKYMYSSETTYTPQSLKEVRGINGEYFENNSKDLEIKIIDSRINTKDKNEKIIVLNYPIIRLGRDNIGSISILLNEKEILNMVEYLFVGEEKEFLILWKNRVVWQLHPVKEGDVFHIQALASKGQTQEEEIELNNRNYQLFYSFSPTTQFQYILCIDKNKALPQMGYIQWGFIVVGLLAMWISAIAIYILMNYTYRPLYTIHSLLGEKEWESIQERNDFKKIEHIIKKLTMQNKALDDELEKIADYQESYLYHSLLEGNCHEHMKDGLKELEKLQHASFRVVIFKTNQEKDCLRILLEEELLHMEQDGVEKTIHCVLKEVKNSKNILQAKLEKIQGIYGVEGERLFIGVGRVYDNCRKITKSFEEAKEAITYRNLSYETEVIWYENIQKSSYTNYLSEHTLIKLKLDMNNENIEAVKENIQQIKESLKGKVITYKSAIFIYDQIVYQVIRHLEDNQYDFKLKQNILKAKDAIEDREALDKVLDQLVEILKEAMSWKIERQAQVVNDKDNLYMHILDDIHQNYGNCHLSIQGLADKHSIALPNLTTYFKKKVGYSPKDYLTCVRMKKAKELLVETSESLNDIANKVGYQNTSSFIRQFKKIEGITPGEYRKMK